MLLCEVGVSERDRSGWKFGSPPVLVHPIAPASMLDGDSTMTSSGKGGAPGSPGFGRLELVEDTTQSLAALTSEGETPPLWKDGRLREAATSELEGLFSPSGWNSSVELFEKVVERLVVVVVELRLLSDDELEAPAVERQVIGVLKERAYSFKKRKRKRKFKSLYLSETQSSHSWPSEPHL